MGVRDEEIDKNKQFFQFAGGDEDEEDDDDDLEREEESQKTKYEWRQGRGRRRSCGSEHTMLVFLQTLLKMHMVMFYIL